MAAYSRIKLNKKIILLCLLAFLFCRELGKASAAIESVAIDPGHGGEDWGCRGLHGAVEKEITLQVAKRLAEIIQDRMGIRTVLTRRGDYYVDLVERTGVANHNKAGLFLGLHANTTFSPGQTGQIMIFITSLPAPGRNEWIGKENFGGTEWAEEVQTIIWDMVQTDLHNESFRLASIIAEEARKAGLWRDSTIKQAPILVLEGANMPAVNIEIDFITSSQGEERLTDLWYQEKVCEVLYRAIVRFGSAIEEDPNAATW